MRSERDTTNDTFTKQSMSSHLLPLSGVQVAWIEIGGAEMTNVSWFIGPIGNVAHEFFHFRDFLRTVHVKSARMFHVRHLHITRFTLQ